MGVGHKHWLDWLQSILPMEVQVEQLCQQWQGPVHPHPHPYPPLPLHQVGCQWPPCRH